MVLYEDTAEKVEYLSDDMRKRGRSATIALPGLFDLVTLVSSNHRIGSSGMRTYGWPAGFFHDWPYRHYVNLTSRQVSYKNRMEGTRWVGISEG
ncbi:MAG: hypothetical protein A4E48_02762 [Methanosaeta sp. PtaU1.Bin060]|nr:MAG: hypothetical protein A4E48_02762 [Methanosaeta sp. PtaU1.Bin060]